ncbi:hypothetical protein GA0074694_3509 [Micromonospora inyonensis]|uniref:Uncharacterized protein n=1 Tax=Micromonospora inyonensis TaxID=47866 RepID=A0A1C6S0N7_9ACTN|nr:hypothetical protein GA0074694_3509 [Micromonospora inyonensis]
MAAAVADPQGYAARTESGVQVDSSVAHQLRALIKALSWFYVRVSMVVLGQLWPAFDGLATA